MEKMFAKGVLGLLMVMAVVSLSFDTKNEKSDVKKDVKENITVGVWQDNLQAPAAVKIEAAKPHFNSERVLVQSRTVSPLHYQWVTTSYSADCSQGGTKIELEGGAYLCCYGSGIRDCYYYEP